MELHREEMREERNRGEQEEGDRGNQEERGRIKRGKSDLASNQFLMCSP